MIRRGEIYDVDWSPGRGSEQKGVRPAIVIQNGIGNAHSSTTIVAAITSQAQPTYPFHVSVAPEESGLPLPSTIKLQQLMTVDKTRLLRRRGSLRPHKMAEVEQAIHISLGLP